MSKLFISHSSQDDGFVRHLQRALGDLGQDVWIDSREFARSKPTRNSKKRQRHLLLAGAGDFGRQD